MISDEVFGEELEDDMSVVDVAHVDAVDNRLQLHRASQNRRWQRGGLAGAPCAQVPVRINLCHTYNHLFIYSTHTQDKAHKVVDERLSMTGDPAVVFIIPILNCCVRCDISRRRPFLVTVRVRMHMTRLTLATY